MNIINPRAIYVLWLREMKRFFRAKSRIIGTLAMPLFFLAFLAFGFRNASVEGIPEGVSYVQFLIPGIIGMNLLFNSTFAGISVLWDREFGFLKEIMVAPVHRVSIVLGRIFGGITTGVIQAVLLMFISMIAGFKLVSIGSLLLAVIFMILIAMTFIGLGLVFASNMKDPHGFQLIINFVIFPLFFLSGALYPVSNLPRVLKWVSLADPLTWGIDGMRGALINTHSMSIAADLIAMLGFSLLMVFLGTYFFEKSESL